MYKGKCNKMTDMNRTLNETEIDSILNKMEDIKKQSLNDKVDFNNILDEKIQKQLKRPSYQTLYNSLLNMKYNLDKYKITNNVSMEKRDEMSATLEFCRTNKSVKAKDKILRILELCGDEIPLCEMITSYMTDEYNFIREQTLDTYIKTAESLYILKSLNLCYKEAYNRDMLKCGEMARRWGFKKLDYLEL
jgi:hypothetical protein